MNAQGGPTTAAATLRRIVGNRRPPPSGERCEMCAEPIPAEHSHVVDLDSRALMCTCRSCYLLFTAENAHLRYRAVPDRYLSFPQVRLDQGAVDGLDIPVGLAFVFVNSRLGRAVAFYPGPAGATESELALTAWPDIVTAHPELGQVRPDVEALLLRRDQHGTDSSCHLVPIDACYALVGRLRQLWRGFDGGSEAQAAMRDFFADVAARSRPAGDPR